MLKRIKALLFTMVVGSPLLLLVAIGFIMTQYNIDSGGLATALCYLQGGLAVVLSIVYIGFSVWSFIKPEVIL